MNGHQLIRSENASSLFGEGAQASLAIYPPDQWAAWDVPAAAVRNGNNTVDISLHPNGLAVGVGVGGAGAGVGGTPSGFLVNQDFGTTGGAPYLHTYKHYSNVSDGALACNAECDADVKCAAWTYVTAGADTKPERCCHFPGVGCPFAHHGCVSGAKKSRKQPCDTSDVVLLKLELSLPVGGQ